MSEPHTPGAGTEEVWTKLTPGTAVMLIGSELREMPQHSAYLVPPTGVTQHANLNLSKDQTESWLYMAHGPMETPAGRVLDVGAHHPSVWLPLRRAGRRSSWRGKLWTVW